MSRTMVRLAVAWLISIGFAVQSGGQEGALTAERIEQLRAGLQIDANARAIRNALTNTGIKSIAENRDVLIDHDEKFSHKIKTKGISNQKSSGRCWMFAGFNMIKPVLMRNLEVDSFEFSHIHLQFWDKMEKANSFLEYMIEYRDRDWQDREVVFLLRSPAPDGGYWENFADLVEKYGVMPKEAMAETASSESTGMMNKALARILRRDGRELREIYEETGSVRKMREAKPRMLAEVYRVLVLNLGEPPEAFTWRHKGQTEDDEEDGEEEDADDEDVDEGDDEDEGYEVEQDWSALDRYTPKAFYDAFVDLDLSEYVNIADDPIRPKGGHYEVGVTKNLTDGYSAHYANVDLAVLKSIALSVLLDNQAVYFAADVSPDQDSTKGIMARDLYDYESIYDLDMGLNKTERLLLRDSTINHGMALIGVDLRDGEPVKWLVENSWGASRGSGGLWTMYDDWFDDNVYNIMIHRDYVPDEVLEIFEQPAVKLPVWDPMW